MPNRRLVTVAVAAAVAIALVAPAAAAQSRSTAADGATIVALEHSWLASNDSATLERILAPDFRHPVASGQIIDKARHIAWVAGHPVAPR